MPFTSVGRATCVSSTGVRSGRPYTWRVLAKTTLAVGLCQRQASSRESWLRQLISRSVQGSRMLSMWLTWPARLKTTSCPCTR